MRTHKILLSNLAASAKAGQGSTKVICITGALFRFSEERTGQVGREWKENRKGAEQSEESEE